MFHKYLLSLATIKILYIKVCSLWMKLGFQTSLKSPQFIVCKIYQFIIVIIYIYY
jgi:hypothetical protein